MYSTQLVRFKKESKKIHHLISLSYRCPEARQNIFNVSSLAVSSLLDRPKLDVIEFQIPPELSSELSDSNNSWSLISLLEVLEHCKSSKASQWMLNTVSGITYVPILIQNVQTCIQLNNIAYLSSYVFLHNIPMACSTHYILGKSESKQNLYQYKHPKLAGTHWTRR